MVIYGKGQNSRRTPTLSRMGMPRGEDRNHLLRLIVIALLALALVGGGLLVLSRAGTEPPVKWQVELNAYLSTRAGTGAGPASVLATGRAAVPSEFRDDLIAGRASDRSFTALGYSVSEAPAPAAPGDVWCVLLGGQDGVRQVVFVVKHETIYLDYWLVSEGPSEPFTPEFRAGLRRIGCELPL